MTEWGSTDAAPAARVRRERQASQPSFGLVGRCQRGDQAAWRELFALRVPQLLRWAQRLGLGLIEAEDAAQEVLVVAARRIDRCHGDEVVGSWLYQITRRVVANARRRQYLRRLHGAPSLRGVEASSSAGPTRLLTPVELELEARRRLSRLTPCQLEVLLLVEIEGFSRREVAERLAIPPGTVASRLRLARAACRR